jgi:predicted nucleotidyltransferase
MNSVPQIPTLSQSTREKLRDAGVAVVYVYSSRVSGHYLPQSDLDVGIVMEDKRLLDHDTGKLYNTVYDILSSDMPDVPGSPRLDLAFLQRANPALAMKAIQEGVILFETSGELRADFEELTLRLYDDYRTLQHEYEEANIQAFERRV